MRQIQIINLTVLMAALLTGAIPDAFAQSGGFPAYSPEKKTEQASTKTVGFPPFSVSKKESPKPDKRYAFPVAGKKESPTTSNKALNFMQLGAMISQMGLEPYPVQSRYDFQYRAELDGQEIELSLSAVLREDDSLIRVSAWLDPLPAGTIPGGPLLDMLSRNEEMKRGLRFAYSKQTGRFLLEKTVPNNEITPEILAAIFQDVSLSVTENWSIWSTSSWKNHVRRPHAATAQEAISEERFEMPVRR